MSKNQINEMKQFIQIAEGINEDGYDAGISEEKCPCGREGCACGPACDCEPVEENDEYDEETLDCKHCGNYYCTSKFGGECPAIQKDLFDEDIDIMEIAESVLADNMPRDYVDEDDMVDIDDTITDVPLDIDDYPEAEDEELGLRFD